MTEYTVIWEINLNADSPMKAALEAQKIHKDSESIATEFKIVDSKTGEEFNIDLEDYKWTQKYLSKPVN